MRPPRIQLRREAGAAVIVIEDGDVDITTAGELGDRLLEAVPNDVEALVLDLSEVSYVDSAGIRMLFTLARRLGVSRQSLALALPDDAPLQRLFAITKLSEVALIAPDVVSCLSQLPSAKQTS